MMRRLFVEPPAEECEAAVWATSRELAAATGFSPKRRREYLAWRAVVRRELGRDVEIGYNAVGAPVLSGRSECISVAHCPGCVAVCISDAPCAVDVESETRNFSRVVSRYLTSVEQALSGDPLWPAAAWCAKEALYKYGGHTGLDLLYDLRLESVRFFKESADPFTDGPLTAACFEERSLEERNALAELSVETIAVSFGAGPDFVSGVLTGRICGGEPLQLRVRRVNGFVVVYIL